jgi:hypothetical protein
MDGRALLLWQFFCLLVTAAGWGVWIWLVTGRPAPFRGTAWLWCGLGGFCAHALVLQGLVYLDVPLARAAWPAFGAAWAGLAVAAWRGWRGRGCGTRPGWSEVRWLAGVFPVVVAVQSIGVFAVGPADYYGKGRYDQANYVVTAQFLVERPFSTTGDDIGLHPWLAKAIETKEQRITQSVAHGALAVVSGTDCQRAYGAISVFFVGLAGLAVAAWLRACAVPRWLAAIGGVGAALGPAVTGVQLDCYFSQASTLFVLPSLAGLLTSRGPLRAWHRVVAALLLGFLLGAYSEVAVVGAGLVVAMRLMAEGPWRARWCDLGWIAAGALLVNPGYLLRLPRFLLEQAAHIHDPNLLAALVPESGTWRGWGRLFLDLPAGRWQDGTVVAAGLLILGLMACALVGRSWRRSRMLLATLLVPVGVLAWLWLLPVLAKYPFAKLAAGFAPLWIGTAILGIAAFVRRPGGVRMALAALLLGAGAISALPQHVRVIRREEVLAELDSPEAHRVRAEAGAHPERTYLVVSDHPLVAQWLCYFARASDVYLDRRHLGDRVVPSETYAFRRLPAAGAALWWLDFQRQGPVASHQPACTLTVRGAVEEGRVTLGRYYLVRTGLDFEIGRPAANPVSLPLWLDFVCTPMAGTAPCELELVDAGGRRQRTTVTGPRMLRFRLALSQGPNRYTLHVQPARGSPSASGGLVVQSLSLDPVTPIGLATDPAPADDPQ